MKLSSKSPQAIVGLDIESGSVAAAEVRVNGRPQLGASGIAALPSGMISGEGEVADAEGLAALLKEFFSRHKLPKQVRIGLASQRVVVRAMRMPLIENPKELESAVRFQAQDHIPMSLDQAVLDYQVVARGIGENDRQMDVVVVAARRDTATAFAQTAYNAGLRPVGMDVSAFGMIRALNRESQGTVPYEQRIGSLGEGELESPQLQTAKLYCNLGDVANLAVAQGSGCRFTRVLTFGVAGIAQRLAERRGLTMEHARQWLQHVGLETPVETVEGDPETVSATRDVLAEGASKLADELRLSLEFYGTQEGALAVEQVVTCGPGAAIGGLVGRLEREIGLPFSVARPATLAHLSDAQAARLTLPYGLALES